MGAHERSGRRTTKEVKGDAIFFVVVKELRHVADSVSDACGIWQKATKEHKEFAPRDNSFELAEPGETRNADATEVRHGTGEDF